MIIAPVYPAGEQPIEGIDRDALIEGIRTRGHRHVLALNSEKDLPALIADIAKAGDYVVFLGAGNINSIPPLDALYKLVAEGQVCLVKLNTVRYFHKLVYG